MFDKPATIGQLKANEYRVLSVRDEMRKNLIGRLRRGETPFPDIIGYEDTVIPQVETAILAGHDVIFLGERGQAKSRLIRSLVNLLDEEVPVIKGGELNDNPYSPVTKYCRSQSKNTGR
jgi:magnesium chelatase subunit I